MPTHGGSFELLRLLLSEQVEVCERILERRPPEFAQRHFGGPKVALLCRAGEASGCHALTRHRRWGPATTKLLGSDGYELLRPPAGRDRRAGPCGFSGRAPTREHQPRVQAGT